MISVIRFFLILQIIVISGCSLNANISNLGGSFQNSTSPSTPVAPDTSDTPSTPSTPPVAPTLSFSISTSDAFRNDLYAGPTPSVTGSDVVFTITPALPSGLVINTATGIISGTPTAAYVRANYTVTATNSGGSAQAVISLAVALKMTVNSLAFNSDASPGNQICADINNA